jgi:hypothetical protein
MTGYFFAPQRAKRWQSKKGLYVSEFLQIIDNGESPSKHSAYSISGCWGNGGMGRGVYWVLSF